MDKLTAIHYRRNRNLLVGFGGVMIFVAMLYSFYSSSRMINIYSPLVDATMEIKFEATTAHLWFEEIISGDRYENIEAIMEHIDQATWYAQAILEGGQNDEGKFFPLEDVVLREKVTATIEHLNEFKEITLKRYSSIESAGIGTAIDQQYDGLFKEFIDQVDDVETLLQKKIYSDFSRYKYVQITLVMTVVLLSFLMFYLLYRYDRAQEKNIVEIKEAKNKAQDNEKWLKTTINSMGDGVITADHAGNVTHLNPVASSLTGWFLGDAKNMKMQDVFNLVDEQAKVPVDDAASEVIVKKVVVDLGNHSELVSKDGTKWPIAGCAAPIFDHDNKLIGVVVIFNEITAQKEAEREKEQLEARLRQAFKMEAIGTMAGGIAHDFNNILAIILGNAELALHEIPTGNQAKGDVEEIFQSAVRAKELVKQILSFSRQQESKKEPYPLYPLVEESIKSIRSTIPSSIQIQLNSAVQGRGNNADCAMALVDPTQVHQLLLNLCANAVQAMDEKGILEISVDEVTVDGGFPFNRPELAPGNYVLISVADTGPGVPPDIVEKVFDPFFTTKDVGKGTGMGLSVVHGIVESHDGKIFVENRKDHGAIFSIYLPVTGKRPAEKIENRDPLPTGNERILLIDDEEVLAKTGAAMIKRQGYHVTVKTDSLEALTLFQDNPTQFDLVITDQTMPNMTGAELAKQLLQIRPGLPIILCTGYSSKVDKVMAREIGIREFVEKPLYLRDIAEVIRKVLDA